MLIKTSFFFISLFVFVSNSYCIEVTLPIELNAYKTILVREYGSNNEEIRTKVIDFVVSRDCYKNDKQKSGKLQGCRKYTSQEIKDNLKKLQDLIHKGQKTGSNDFDLAGPKYSVNDFELVIQTLIDRNVSIVDEARKAPKFPTTLLFPADQNGNIIEAIFRQEKDVIKRREKIKTLIGMAENTEKLLAKGNFAPDDPEDNILDDKIETEKQNKILKEDLSFYTKDEEASIEQQLLLIAEAIEETKNNIEFLKREKSNDLLANIEELEQDKLELNNEQDALEKKLAELKTLSEEQLKQKITLTKKILTSRSDTKAVDLTCPNILHLAVSYNDLDLVNFVIESYKKAFGIKTAKKEKTNRELVKYLDQKTYDANQLNSIQNEYMNKNKNAKIGACFSVTINDELSNFKEFLGRNGVLDMKKLNQNLGIKNSLKSILLNKYTPLEIAYTSAKKDNSKLPTAFDIMIELIENGASYKEDLNIVYGIKSTDQGKLQRKTPKYYTTIFEDFFVLGGLTAYKDKKEKILEALTTGNYITRSQHRASKERYESLLNQAIDRKDRDWCTAVLKAAEHDDGTFESDIAYSSVYENRKKSTKDEREIKRAKSYANFLVNINPANKNHYYGRMNNKIDKIEKTPFEAAVGTPCAGVINEAYDRFSKTLKNNLAKDLNAWHSGQEVYSIIHHKACNKNGFNLDSEIKLLFDNKQSLSWITEKYPQSKPILSSEDQTYLKLSASDMAFHQSLREAILDFILEAKDDKGNTPWYYGTRTKSGGAWKDYTGDPQNKEAVKAYLRTKLNI